MGINSSKGINSNTWVLQLISSDGRNNTEIASRVAQAKKTFQRMKSILTNNYTRRAMDCNIELILMYGCEAWTISKQVKKKVRQQNKIKKYIYILRSVKRSRHKKITHK